MAGVTDRLAGAIAGRHRRRLEVGVFAIAAGWHLGNDLPMLLSNRNLYHSFAVAAFAWAAMTLILAFIGWSVVRSAGPPVCAVPLTAVVLLLGALVVAVCPAGHQVSMANWAFGGVGWITVFVLVRQPRHAVTAVLLGPLATLAAVLGHRDLGALPVFLIAGYAICALQVAVATGARLIQANTTLSVQQARLAADREVERRYAEEVVAEQARRYVAVGPATEFLLAGLADETLAPQDPQVRERCALEAARLRRLCAGGGNVFTPLLRDLNDLADAAHRHGIRFELHVAGDVGDVPDPVRAALTRVAGRAAAQARGFVRVTVLATTTGVSLGGAADGPAPTDVAVPDTMALTCGGGEGHSWWEASWDR